jgi:CheY-like chemotaxis protein
MKVLIAEDNMISCRALANNIEKWGYEVVTTHNGQEAWEALNATHGTQVNGGIHIALLDWEMPKINGIELKIRLQNGKRISDREKVQEKLQAKDPLTHLRKRKH